MAWVKYINLSIQYTPITDSCCSFHWFVSKTRVQWQEFCLDFCR